MRRARSIVFAGAALLALGAAAPAGSPTGPDAPVADAAMRGDLDAVRSLLVAGEDVNGALGDGMTALHWAA
ncbi:MAG: ankyrin repeat domain-containing protein, partial [Gemmatimonadales bacterium]|nr:ankyrin repeat domain-containing protein [Gemmatimonadales bacterium]